jgi:hypothetical protein
MKIALCFKGLVGYKNNTSSTSIGAALDPSIGFKYHMESIIQPNRDDGHQVDIFLHSWSSGQKEELLSLYQPKESTIEEQYPFETKRKIDDGFTARHVKLEFSALSSYSSTKKVIGLKQKVEEQENFTYDAVMVLRYDIVLKDTKLHIQDYDMKYFYSNDNERYSPSTKKTHIIDYWFLSNSRYMDLYSTICDKFEKYNTDLDPNKKRGGLLSNHSIQMTHANEFAKNKHKKLFSMKNILFVRNI